MTAFDSRLVTHCIGQCDVSHDMAIRLGKACGNGTRFWLALQMQFDLWGMEQERTFQIDVAPLKLDSDTAA